MTNTPMNIIQGRRTMTTIQQRMHATDDLTINLISTQTGPTVCTVTTMTMTRVTTIQQVIQRPTHDTLQNRLVTNGTIVHTSLGGWCTQSTNNTATDIIGIIYGTIKSIIVIISTMHSIDLTSLRGALNTILGALTT
jgi:hypothetical protein